MIFIELVFDVAPENVDEVRALAQRTTDSTLQEDGCTLYRFTSDLQSPSRFVLTELWESEEALTTHFAGAAFTSFWAELPPGGAFVHNAAWQGPLASYEPPNPSQ